MEVKTNNKTSFKSFINLNFYEPKDYQQQYHRNFF